jgi:protein-L-isoaspartate(D-aspartate) O-methyltransferase
MGTKEQLIMELKAKGINHSLVLQAIQQIPRNRFVLKRYQKNAFDNSALPIDCHQTISQPYIVALMTQQLFLCPSPRRILEIGTGSGYQTAILSQLFEQIFTVERIPALHKNAHKTLEKLDIHNVSYKLDDGYKGWAEFAPYDGILVTACANEIPVELITQLSPNGGVMVIPVGKKLHTQKLLLVQKFEHEISRKVIEWVAFVPLVR